MVVAAPSAQKYDRQLRIWGEHGQRALEGARVCVLGAGPTGTEALKNLVLGGIGAFTLVDDAAVMPGDLGNNFFVDSSSMGASRARVAAALLQELNEGVAASYVEDSPSALLTSNPKFFADFTLIIATQMCESEAVRLEGVCVEHGVPLLLTRSYGLMGLLRISAPEHCIMESKPDSTVDDLRLHKPWPELLKHGMEYDLDMHDSMLHRHIPHAIILLQAAHAWQQGGRALPRTAKERAEFKAWISSHQRHPDEENYREALAAAFKVWAPPSISSDLSLILEQAPARVSPSSDQFWLLAAALKMFMEQEGEGEVPLEGSIPDMHSITEFYIALQRVYASKADADVAAVQRHLGEVLRAVGRDAAAVAPAAVKLFCKNARHLQVIRFKSLKDEFSPSAHPNPTDLHRLLSSANARQAWLYILLRAADQFSASLNHYPGTFPGDVDDDDVARLKSFAAAIVTGGGSPGSSPAVPDDLTAEMCRFGASELHCVAAVVGGVASQEAIKLITKQFVPLSGTFIYDAISQSSAVLHL